MAHITNGSATYERRVKTGDYEHKHAAVTINFALEEGEDADKLLATVGELATHHAHQILRGKSAPAAPVVDVVAPAPEPTPAVVEPVVEEVIPEDPQVVELLPKKRGRRTKAEMLAERLGPVPEVVNERVNDLFPVEVIEDLVAEAPAPTDAELGTALGRVNAKIGREPIEKLMGEFIEKGQNWKMIPGVRRAEFITRLETLEKQ